MSTWGGGVARIIVGGSTQIDGKLSADGSWDVQSTSRRSSPGSVYLQTASLAGTGMVQAVPIAANTGGGRVAVVVTNGTGAGGVELRANSLGGNAGAGSVYLRDTAGGRVTIDDRGNGGTKYCPVPGTFPGDATYPAVTFAPEEDFGGVDFVVTNGGRMKLWKGPVSEFGYERYAPLGGIRAEAGTELSLTNAGLSWVGEVIVNGTSLPPNATYSAVQINAQAGGSVATGDGAVRVGLYLFHSPATNASTSGATIDGFMGAKGPSDPEVFLAWGLGNGGTDTNNWDTLDTFGSVGDAGRLSTNLDGRVTANRTYFFRLFGTNDSHHYWSEPVETFLAGDVWVEGTDTNAAESGDEGTVTLQRPETATNGPLIVHLDIGGTAEPDVDYQAISSVVTMQTGQASLSLTITPIDDDSPGDETVSFTIVHRRGSYGIHAGSNAVTVNVSSAPLPPGYNAWLGSDPALGTNWSLGHVPTNTETVYLSGLTSNLVWSSAMPDTVGGWVQTPTYAGTVTVQTVFPGHGTLSNLNITGDIVISNGVLTHVRHLKTATVQKWRLSVTVGGDLRVGDDGHISGDYVGFADGGPGFGHHSDQASYGGMGNSGRPTYGSVLQPANIGSSGDGPDDDNNWAGGMVRLVVSGLSRVDGTISANGGDYGSRAGSGGSVYLATGTLSGDGTIQASPTQTGGGGGRVAVVTAGVGFGDVDIRANCTGGNGGNGSVYLQDASTRTVVIDNSGISSDNYCYVPGTFTGSATYAESDYVFEESFDGVDFIVRNRGRMRLANNVWARDILVLPDCVLELGPYDLTVEAHEHDVGGGLVSNSGLGGRIIWTGPPPGSVLMFR